MMPWHSNFSINIKSTVSKSAGFDNEMEILKAGNVRQEVDTRQEVDFRQEEDIRQEVNVRRQ